MWPPAQPTTSWCDPICSWWSGSAPGEPGPACIPTTRLLAATLAPLPSAYAEQQGDTDADARRFDLLLYTMQLTLLRSEPRFASPAAAARELGRPAGGSPQQSPGGRPSWS